MSAGSHRGPSLAGKEASWPFTSRRLKEKNQTRNKTIKVFQPTNCGQPEVCSWHLRAAPAVPEGLAPHFPKPARTHLKTGFKYRLLSSYAFFFMANVICVPWLDVRDSKSSIHVGHRGSHQPNRSFLLTLGLLLPLLSCGAGGQAPRPFVRGLRKWALCPVTNRV